MKRMLVLAVLLLIPVSARAQTQVDIQRLHRRVAQVAPITGVSVGDPSLRMTWAVRFAPEATAAQRSTAASILSTWTPVDFEPSAGELRMQALRRLAPLRAEYQSLQAESPTTPTPEYTQRLLELQGEIRDKRAEAGLR